MKFCAILAQSGLGSLIEAKKVRENCMLDKKIENLCSTTFSIGPTSSKRQHCCQACIPRSLKVLTPGFWKSQDCVLAVPCMGFRGRGSVICHTLRLSRVVLE